MNKKRRPWTVPFLDLSNVLFFFFSALFAVALLVIAEDTTKAKVDTTSKLLVHLVWADNSPNDIDLSLKTPSGHVIWFRQKEADYASLDHDNLGMDNARVINAEGNDVMSAARDEVIFVRQTMPGVYIVNVNLYRQSRTEPEPITVTLTSVEPSYAVTAERKLILTENHEEHTAFRFTVDDRGNVTGTDAIEELFINDMLGKPS